VPFEYASLLDDVFRQHGTRDNTRIILAVPVPFPFAGPPAKELFCKLLQDMDIEYWPEHVVTKVEETTAASNDNSADKKQSTVHFTVAGGDGTETINKSITVDGLFCTFPQRAPDFMASLCNPAGYVPVDLQTNQCQGYDNIFVIGDACHAVFPKPGKPHPKAGEFAWKMGQHVADQLVAKYNSSSSDDNTVPPPPREALCVAECGVAGQGVNVQPNFTDVLAHPAEGLPKFAVEIVEGASQRKLAWINHYLGHMFGVNERLPEDL